MAPEPTASQPLYHQLNDLHDEPDTGLLARRDLTTPYHPDPAPNRTRPTSMSYPPVHSSTVTPTAPPQSDLLTFLALTCCFTGLQFTWSVEMAYGTPYLLSLGLPKSLMSLVWLAGPLSGLIMQPLVGAWSDRCRSVYGRRRPFMVVASGIVAVCFITLAWAPNLTGIFGGSAAATGEPSTGRQMATIWLAVVSIYALDFAVNVIQACCRALIVDALPPSKQEHGTAWASRMTGIGNVLGYLTGYMDLVRLFPFLGDTQLKSLSLVAILVLFGTIGTTCYFIHEEPAQHLNRTVVSPWTTLTNIISSARNLPQLVRLVCNIQFFSWIGWFPFLFYSTTYVASIYSTEHPLALADSLSPPPSTVESLTPSLGASLAKRSGAVTDPVGASARAGSYALLIYALVSLAVSWLLPFIVTPSSGLVTAGPSHTFRSGPQSSHGHGSSSSSLFARLRRLMQSLIWHVRGFQLTLPRIWTFSQIIFAVAMLSTFFIVTTAQVTFMIAVCGFCWSVSMWAPFSLIGEYLSQHRWGVDLDVVPTGGAHTEYNELRVLPPTAGGPRAAHPPRRQHRTRSRDQFLASTHPSKCIDDPLNLDHRGAPRHSDGGSGLARNRTRSVPALHTGETQSPVIRLSGHHAVSTDQVHVHFDSDSDSDRGRYGDSGRRPLNPVTATASPQPITSPLWSPVDPLSPPIESEGSPDQDLSAGIILGIHNMFVVMPQFLISFVSSIIFALFESGSNSAEAGAHEPADNNAVTIGWILRIGGVASLVAAYLSLQITKVK
ncbi:hypothetical protein H4R33_005546 [Dimargaris cristalligena]|nr:hypothetical protein H4R33_005546 [Dimargaris cristalligena]